MPIYANLLFCFFFFSHQFDVYSHIQVQIFLITYHAITPFPICLFFFFFFIFIFFSLIFYQIFDQFIVILNIKLVKMMSYFESLCLGFSILIINLFNIFQINELSHVNIPVMLLPDDFRAYSKLKVDNHLFNKYEYYSLFIILFINYY